MPSLELTKHHGLGNDFLVLLHRSSQIAVDLPAVARALCDRRRGIGADGLIVALTTTDADARMVLHNADGSRAEMSGNGIRCLAQAMADAGWCGDERVVILTDAGARAVDVGPEVERGIRAPRVAMGAAKVTRLDDTDADVDVGNPHLVLRADDLAAIDLLALGAQHPDLNVEVIRVDDRANVTMRVHERGAGITEACGTGSCAVVAATVAWGLTGKRVVVHNPGGPLTVEVDVEDVGDAWLSGPAQRIADRIDVEVRAEWR